MHKNEYQTYLDYFNPTYYTVNRKNVKKKKNRRKVNAKSKIKRTIRNKTTNSIRSKRSPLIDQIKRDPVRQITV